MRPDRSADEVLGRALPPNESVASFLWSFRRRESPCFFFKPEEAADIASHLEGAVPGWSERTIADADAISRRRLRLLGADQVDLGAFAESLDGKDLDDSLPWHWDVLSRYGWNPRTFYQKIEIPYDRADIKVPWELSRCQHLPTLGMAYLLTKDDRYPREVVMQIDDWIRRNPPGYGVNWACAMDVAVRAVNWLWAYHLIALAPIVSDPFLTRFLASLLAHGRHISRNIEEYQGGITTNHTLADYVGLFYLGLLLPEIPEAARWIDVGMNGVEGSMRFQVAADGVDFENSIAYHRLVLEMFIGSYVLAERNGRHFPDSYRSSLERMLEFVYSYTQPNGLAPLVGDSDDGRLQILSQYFDWKPDDHRYLLGIGGSLFERDDFSSLARDVPNAQEEAAWLLGILSPRASKPAARFQPTSRAFPKSGRYIMRHKDHYAFVSADEVGTAGLGNHKHNDIFSFHLTVGGVPIILDSGSFVYTRDRAWRDYFRSTSAHNTVVVDGAEQNEMAGPFWMLANARVSVARWETASEFDLIDATHTGYERLPEPVAHRRRILFIKEPFSLVVLDNVRGRGEHKVESFVHLAPEGAVLPMEDSESLRSRIQISLAAAKRALNLDCKLEPYSEAAHRYLASGTTIAIMPLNWSSVSIEQKWLAPRYGQRVAAPVLRLFDLLGEDRTVGYLITPERETDWD